MVVDLALVSKIKWHLEFIDSKSGCGNEQVILFLLVSNFVPSACTRVALAGASEDR